MPVRVLLVEDNRGDLRLTQEAFLGANNSIHLLVASDGLEAIAFLRQLGAYVHAPRPDIIFLDLHLPKLDGCGVLAHVKADSTLRSIPVIILTTSDAQSDILKSYQLQANCYLCKPVSFFEFEHLVNSISDFWLTKVKLPRDSHLP
jgi:chemotaxis family two-component system response regulator Rcp1